MGKSKFSYKKVIVIKLNRFEVVSGKYIEEISGQSRIGYSMSDTTDFYDMIEWSKKGGYQGSIISFYDYNCKFCSNGTPILKSAVHSF